MDSIDPRKYEHALTDYLIDCCLWSELACSRKTPEEFHKNRMDVYNHWDEIVHVQKHCIPSKENLIVHPGGENIMFPSIVRSVSCQIAKHLPNNPMTGRGIAFIHEYVSKMMGKPARVFNG